MTTVPTVHKEKRDMKVWVTLLRGLMAIVLGAALIFQPDKARPLLVNFMGGFWLAGGLVSLRWGASGERARRWSIIAGIVGVLAGLVTISRKFMMVMLPEEIVAYLLGGVMIMTGIMHISTGQPEDDGGSRRSWASIILGIFEILLGVSLFLSPLEYGPMVYWGVTLWAFFGGILLFTEAWRRHKREQEVENTA